MASVALLVRRHLRNRWRGLVVVGLIIGVVGAVTLAAVAGARRTSTALTRFETSSRAADLEFATSAGPRRLRALARIPGVLGIGVLRAYGIVVPAAPDFQQVGAPVGGGFGVDVDRDRFVAGHDADPNAVDEVTVGESLARRLGISVGDALPVESFSPAQIDAILEGTSDVGPRAGPPVQLRVVGVVRRPLDLGESGANGGLLLLTSAFDRAYAERIGAFGYRVRVRTGNSPGETAHVLAESRRILGPALFTVQGLALENQGASDAIDVLTRALWIAAAVAALAGATAIAIVLSREISFVTNDQDSLRALGCARRDRFLAALVPAGIAAVGGLVVAGVGVVALSPLFPLGVARRADPNVGVHVDWFALGLGMVLAAALVGSIACVAALRVTQDVRVSADRPVRTSMLARLAAPGVASPPATMGVRLAVEPGRGTRLVPVRSAFFGAILGVLGVVATLVFAANVDHLASTPRLYGATWSFQTRDVTANTPCGAGDRGLRDVPGVAALTEVCVQNIRVDGRPVTAQAYTRVDGPSIGAALIAGRRPHGTREVALGGRTLAALGKHIGDRVVVSNLDVSRGYRIVGRVVLPTLGASQPLGDGAVFSGRGYAPVFDQNLFERHFVGRTEKGASLHRVARGAASIEQLSTLTGARVPVEIDRLRQIDWLPRSLMALFGGLVLLAVGHAIVTGVGRRRLDLAVLKTLGFTRRQLWATVSWQATVLVGAGLAVGVPLGVVVGGFTWRAVAEGLGIAGGRVVPTPAIVAVAAGAVVAVNLIAAVPGRAVARLRPAAALRAE